MNNPTSDFNSNWENFCAWVKRQPLPHGKSSMWQNLILDFGLREFPEDKSILFRPNGFRAYNLVAKSEETANSRIKRIALAGSYAVSRAASFLKNRIWQANVAGMSNDRLAFHPAGMRWLRILGLQADYRKFCDAFRLSPYNASAIKSAYVSSIIRPYLANIERASFLEVGGGFGTLAAMLQFHNPLARYVIVDLPEMLLHSSLSLQSLHPNVPAYFLYPGSETDTSKDGFYFCTPDSVGALGESGFDFACNIDSFQEMTEQQVTGYLQLAQSAVKHDGYFLNINRRKYLEAEGFDNNPLMYPYAASNKIIRWETDLFFDRTLNYDNVRLDGWMLRLEQLKKGRN